MRLIMGAIGRSWFAPGWDATRCARPLLRNGALLRWCVVALVAVRAIGAPPALAAPIMPWIICVAGYNAALPSIGERLSPIGAARVAKVLVLADAVSVLTLVVIFPGCPPGALYAGLTLVLLEAAVCWSVAGVVGCSLIALAGSPALDGLRCSLLHLPMPWGELVAQNVVVTLLSAGLVMVYRLLQSGQALPPPLSPEATPLPSRVRLSSREQEVLGLMAEGCSNTMIAGRLHVTESTVKRHVESILNRLNVRNRAGAVAAASRLGLLD